MKIKKIAAFILFLLPVLLSAQENKTVVTQVNENSVTFTIPTVLDSKDIVAIKEVIQQLINSKGNNETTINPIKKIEANDIIYDDHYIYALNVREAYDDDYGPYHYTEWKITQYLKSSYKIIAETDYMEGKGKFSTFKELEAQKDFRPVKECKLAQLAFQAMYQQENLK